MAFFAPAKGLYKPERDQQTARACGEGTGAARMRRRGRGARRDGTSGVGGFQRGDVSRGENGKSGKEKEQERRCRTMKGKSSRSSDQSGDREHGVETSAAYSRGRAVRISPERREAGYVRGREDGAWNQGRLVALSLKDGSGERKGRSENDVGDQEKRRKVNERGGPLDRRGERRT